MPAEVVENPGAITVKSIEEEKNAEVRRVRIERYGFSRYLVDARIEEKQRDDFGVLYRKEVSNEPAMQFVLVKNSTPEPDGSYKEFCLPVSNTVRTAHEAVASTFGLEVANYAPEIET